MTYFDELREAMAMLAKIPQSLFVGQSVLYDSNAMFRTLQHEDRTPIVPLEKRIEVPVIEDFQLGMCTGLALAGFLPVSIFPRWDFLLLATNQLVNHLDKFRTASQGQFQPAVIIRTAVGSSHPFSSGIQQSGDYSAAFKMMLHRIEVIELNSKFDIMKGYDKAVQNFWNGTPSLVVERMDLYNDA